MDTVGIGGNRGIFIGLGECGMVAEVCEETQLNPIWSVQDRVGGDMVDYDRASRMRVPIKRTKATKLILRKLMMLAETLGECLLKASLKRCQKLDISVIILRYG